MRCMPFTRFALGIHAFFQTASLLSIYFLPTAAKSKQKMPRSDNALLLFLS
jgi:hypothetical protein